MARPNWNSSLSSAKPCCRRLKSYPAGEPDAGEPILKRAPQGEPRLRDTTATRSPISLRGNAITTLSGLRRQSPTPSAFIDRSHVWQAPHLVYKTCEQRRGVVSSPRESQGQRQV